MFKSLRRYYWLSQVFVKKHSSIIVRSTSIILAILSIFILFSRYLPTPKQTIKIGRVGKYTLSTLPQDIENMISQGLVQIDDTGNIKGGLASSWEIQNDGKSYIFTLDTTKKWHDGNRVTSKDINYNFQDVTQIKDEDTITFNLLEPYSPFMQAMTKPILKDSSLGTLDWHIAKYKLVRKEALQSITLENKQARLLYKFYPTENSALTAYKLGEIDMLENLSAIPTELATDKATTIQTGPGDKIAALFMNNSDALLSSKTTRQGLSYAIPDKSFGKTRAISPISKNSWAYNDLVKDYNFDESRAKTLFTQDVPDSSGIKLELKTMLPYLDVAESIADSWRSILGVNVEVKVVSSLTSDYQMILADFAPPSDPDQYTLWHSTQATNFTKYSNLKVDKLLEDGRRTLDYKLRKETYQDFQRFLLEDSPAIFLFDTENINLARKKLI